MLVQLLTPRDDVAFYLSSESFRQRTLVIDWLVRKQGFPPHSTFLYMPSINLSTLHIYRKWNKGNKYKPDAGAASNNVLAF